MATSKLSKAASPKLSKGQPAYVPSSALSSANSLSNQSRVDAAVFAADYENYVRLPELRKLWNSRGFPDWCNESVVKTSLAALEITFRFISIKVSDPRPYVNHREWKRRLESLAVHQLELIAAFFEDEEGLAGAPVTELSSAAGVLTRERSSQEVWKVPGRISSVVSRTSEASLLPRLASWEKTEDLARKIGFEIESQFCNCVLTLGLGEPNLAGKPTLEYDLIVRPTELHALKHHNNTTNRAKNYEDQSLFTILQILESWLAVAGELLSRIERSLDGKQWSSAAKDCWVLERIWKFLLDIEDLHLLMDADDVLRLKAELAITGDGGSFCFRSPAMLEVTKRTKDLRIKVPWIVGVEVDPSGGPRVQEAAMKLFHHNNKTKHNDGDDDDVKERVNVLQSFQALEAAMKRFFFAYRQIISAVMGSLEAGGNTALFSPATATLDSLSQAFLEPPYFPSLDAAKTFLGNYWLHKHKGQKRHG